MTASTEFDAYARSYDLLYQDKDYTGEAAFVHSQIQRHSPGARRLLELGCGTGAHAVRLAEAGYEVRGIDISPHMLARAEAAKHLLPLQQAEHLQFEQGDIRHLELGEQFDAVISLFHVMGYQTTDDDLADALACAVRHLRPDGILLFDFWYGPGVLHEPPSVRIKRAEDATLSVTRLAEPVMHHDRNVAVVNYQLFVHHKASTHVEQVHESHAVRYWFWPELQRHFQAAGLVPEGLWKWRTEQAAANSQDWLVYTVCRRQQAAA